MNIAEAHKYYEEEVKPILAGGEFARRMKEAIDEAERMTEFYNASVVEHRKSIELIDSLERQIEVLRPVYEAAKILIPAQEYGSRKDINNATHAFVRAVNLAARELEDSND